MVSSHIIVSLEVRVLVGHCFWIPSHSFCNNHLYFSNPLCIPNDSRPNSSHNAFLIPTVFNACYTFQPQILGWERFFPPTLVSVYQAMSITAGLSLVHDLRSDFHDSFRYTGILLTVHSSFNVQKLLYLSGVPQSGKKLGESFSGCHLSEVIRLAIEFPI